MSDCLYTTINGAAVDLTAIPLVSQAVFRQTLTEAVQHGARVACLTVLSVDGTPRLLLVLARDRVGEIDLVWTEVGTSYPA